MIAAGVHLAHFPGMHVIDTVEHAEGLRRDEVAAGNANVRACHGRVRQAHREQRLDFHAQSPTRLLRRRERNVVGHAHAAMKTACVPSFLQLCFDLRARAVDENEVNAECREQIQVGREIEEAVFGDEIAAERDHERLAAKRMDIGCNRLEPVDEAILARQTLAPGRGLRCAGRAIGRRVRICWLRDGVLLLYHACERPAWLRVRRGY